MSKIFFLIFLSSELLSASSYKLNLNWKAEPEFGGFYEALRNNEFKKRGLDIKIIEGGSGTPTVQILANDKTDFAIVSADEILINNDRNPKNKVAAIFAVYQTNPQIIMCRSEVAAKNLGEVFAQEKLIISAQSALSYFQFLKKKYPVKAKVVPDPGGIASFISQPQFCQQGFITSEPLVAQKAGLKHQEFLVADEGFNPYTAVLAVSEKFRNQNPKVVTDVREAVRAGWESYLKNPLPTNNRMHVLNKAMDLETFQKSADAQKKLIMTTETQKTGLGVMSEERWVTLHAQMKDLGNIKKEQNVKEVFFNSEPESVKK